MKAQNDSQHIAGDGLSPENWVEIHGDYLYCQACFRLDDQKLAREAVTDTFLSAIEKRSGFIDAGTEREWLMAILTDKIDGLYQFSHAGAESSFGKDLHEDKFFSEADGYWKPEHLPQKITFDDSSAAHAQELQTFLQNLPALWRYAFTMKFGHREPTGSLIHKLNISRTDFWVIMHRSKIILRSYLQKNRT